MKEASSLPSVGSGMLVVGVTGPSRGAWSSSAGVSFLCLMMILCLSWLGEGREVALGSMGLVSRRSVCIAGERDRVRKCVCVYVRKTK